MLSSIVVVISLIIFELLRRQEWTRRVYRLRYELARFVQYLLTFSFCNLQFSPLIIVFTFQISLS